jgi:hypothetical protein
MGVHFIGVHHRMQACLLSRMGSCCLCNALPHTVHESGDAEKFRSFASQLLSCCQELYLSAAGVITAQKTIFLRLATFTAAGAEKSKACYEIKNGLDR